MEHIIYRLDIRKYLFSQTTINEWNISSTDCVNVNYRSVKYIKKVHKYLRRAGYTQMTSCWTLAEQWRPCPLAIWAFALDGNLVKSACCTYTRVNYVACVFRQVSVRALFLDAAAGWDTVGNSAVSIPLDVKPGRVVVVAAAAQLKQRKSFRFHHVVI